MIGVSRDINTGPGADFNRWLIVHHLFSFSRHDVNDFFRAGVIMPSVPFSLSEFDHPETKALGIGSLRLAEEMNFSPVKLKTVYILPSVDNTLSKLLPNRGNLIPFSCIEICP